MDDVVFCLKLLISHAEKEKEIKKASEFIVLRLSIFQINCHDDNIFFLRNVDFDFRTYSRRMGSCPVQLDVLTTSHLFNVFT